MTADIFRPDLTVGQINIIRRQLRVELERHQLALRCVGLALGPDDVRAVEYRIAELQDALRAIEAPIADLVERMGA